MLITGICRPRAIRHSALGLGGRARVWVWMLISLIFLATLAPAISRTLDHGKSMVERGWVEVCSAHGMAWVKPQTDAVHLNLHAQSGAADAGLLQQLDACGFCALGIDRSTPPPDFSGWGLSLPLPTVLPALAGMGPGSHAWLTVLARGPPNRS